jgi:peptide/nickel transport system substrate-binding protein
MIVPFSVMMDAVVAQDEAESEKVLRIGFLQNVDNLNPFLGLNDASYVFYGLVYDYPHSVDNDLNITSNLVVNTSAVPLTDPEMAGMPFGSIWEYDITPNAQWHDGEPFTVEDFVYNINLQCSDQTFDLMWAFQPYSYFMKSARAVDSDTVRVYFYDRETGDPKGAAYAYNVGILMLPSHLLKAKTPSEISFDWNGVFKGLSPPIVGTGPFMATDRIFEEWTAGSQLTLVRNPNYHGGPDKNMYVKFDKIQMRFYDDATAMRLALTSTPSDLDIAQFPPETYKALKEEVQSGKYKDITVFDAPRCTGYWTEIEVCMNAASGEGTNPSRLDPVIRQAMATATNKSYIVQNYYRGLADEGTTLMAPVYEKWHYEPTEAEEFKYDLDAAAELLESSGYRYPFVGAEFRVAMSDSYAVKNTLVPLNTALKYKMLVRQEYPEEQTIARYLKEQWKEIGIGLEITVLAESAMSTLVYSYAYDTCIWYWSMDVDPNYMLYCQSKLSWSGWSDNMYTSPAYEENYSKSVSAMDEAQRQVFVDNCQRIHYQDCAFIIMAVPYQTYAWRTDTFEGWGDWAAHPGRSMDAFWGANPLFFDLEYVGGGGGGFDIQTASIAAGVVAAIVVVAVVYLYSKKKGKKASPLGE